MSVPQPPNTVADSLPSELNALISEEVLRARVQKIFPAAKPQNIFMRNIDQFVLVIFGFLLTWGVGTQLTSGWERSRVESARKIEQERRETDARIVAFTDFLGTVSEQHARSSLVNDAFKNRAPISELAVLVQSEQEIFAKSQNKTGVLTFTIRQLVPAETYDKIKNAMESGLIEPLRQARVNHGYMYYEITNRPSTSWTNISGLSPRLSVCSAALTHAIWYQAIAPQSDDIAFIAEKQKSLRQMEEDCQDKNR
jgi:hypothetical protein